MKSAMRAIAVAAVCFVAIVFVRAALLSGQSGQWQAAGTTQPHDLGAMAQLPDGRLLVTGGGSSAADAFNTDGSISALPAMSVSRTGHTASTIGGGVLVVGGDATGTAEIFDAGSGAWRAVGSLVTPRGSHTATVLADGRVLIAGGTANGAPTASLEIYDPATVQFSSAGSLSTARTQHATIALLDGRVLIAGGLDATGAALNSVEVFDPATGTVSTGPSMAAARAQFTLSPYRHGLGDADRNPLDYDVIAVGGTNGQATLASVEIFDPSTNAWTPGGELGTARAQHVAISLPHNNSVLVVGGTAGTSAELYYPWAGAAAPTGTTSEAHLWGVGAALDAPLALVAGGGSRTIELYTAATLYTDKDDYTPGEPVAITGTGWQPGEAVTLSLKEDPAIDTHPDIAIVADASGNIATSEFAPDQADLGVHFHLIARGNQSRRQALAVFQDGNATSVSGTVKSSASGNPAIVGAMITCTSGCNNSPAATTTSGAGGAYVFNNTTTKLSFNTNGPVTLVLTASAAGFNPESITLTNVNNSDTRTNQNFVLTPSAVATTLTLNSVTPSSVAFGSSGPVTFVATLTRTSGGAAVSGAIVSFTVDGTSVGTAVTDASGVATLATYDPSSLSTAGHNIAASFAAATIGATSYAGSNSGTLALTINQAGQTIAFNTLPDKTYGDADFTLSATGGPSGNPVTFSTTSTACTLSGTNNTTVHIAGTGSCSIKAAQAGNSNYGAAQDVVQSFTINAKTLTASLTGTITKPYDGNTNATLISANFQIAGLVGTDSFTVTKTSGTYNSKDVVSANTVTAQLAAADFTAASGTLASNYNLPITASGPGQITTKSVSVSITGNHARPYDGTTNATLAATDYTLMGAISTETITVTKTAGSYNSKDVNAAASVTVTLTAADFGITGTGALLSNYSLPTSATGAGHITAATVTAMIIGSPTKPYDRNTNATLTSANFQLNGVVSGEGFTVTQTAGAYNSKDVLTANTITATLAATDFTPAVNTSASNYNLPTTASGAGHITALGISGSFTADSRVYDGTTAATISGRSLTGVLTGDTVSLSGGVATFDNRNAGMGKTVTATGFSLAGADAANYLLTGVGSTTATILQRPITVSAVTDMKVYDNTTASAGSPQITSTYTPAIVSPDVASLAQAFDSPNAGARTLTPFGSVSDGNSGANYSINPVTALGQITQRQLAVNITAPVSGVVYPVNTTVTFTGNYSNCVLGVAHTAVWSFDTNNDPGTSSACNDNNNPVPVTATHTFAAAGIYKVKLTVTSTDSTRTIVNSIGSATTVGGLDAFVVIYDPNGGFVTGGGWITSAAGAFAANPILSGKATFGFVSKYAKGATRPTGETEFNFQVANFNFHSTSYDWLVVSGALAQYKGSGTINGAGDYGFMLTARDGSIAGGGGVDGFRIKITEKTSGAVIYDNMLGASDDMTASNTQLLGGGSVVIHRN